MKANETNEILYEASAERSEAKRNALRFIR